MAKPNIQTVQAQLVTWTTSEAFERVVFSIENALNPPLSLSARTGLLAGVKSDQDVVDRVEKVTRGKDFLIFDKLEHFKWMRLFNDSETTERNAVYTIGNPLIARKIWSRDMRGSLFLPYRILLVDKGGKGTEITYYRPSSLLAHDGDQELRERLQNLDGKIESFIRRVTEGINTNGNQRSKL